ncbi:MAG: nucleotidyltransferase family protein [Sphingomonadaceae bacterium]
MGLPALRRSLLALAGSGTVPRLDAAGWQTLNRLAAIHRLQPLLHAERGHDPAIPAEVRENWKTAHRLCAIQALAIRAALEECHALLERAGHQPIALKGAWLTRHAYPQAAMRPMRDVDIWVPAEQVMDAFQALRGAGYVELEPAEMTLADSVRLDKHLPALLSPRGVPVELHHRLWEPHGRLDHASPRADETAIRNRAVLDEGGIRMLAPRDTLAHLVVHAVYSHRFDCGPLLLSDIDFLCRAASIDWPQFWAEAEAGRWQAGARLAFELVRHWRPQARIELAGDPVPPELAGAACDLLLQDLGTRQSAQLAAATLKGGAARLLQRSRGRRSAKGEAPARRDMSHAGGALGWAFSRGWRSVSQLARLDVRRQSRQLAALSIWLDSLQSLAQGDLW